MSHKCLDRYGKYGTMAVDHSTGGDIIMAEDPWGYIHYRNVTGSSDSGGSGCSPRCIAVIGWALIIILSIIGGCSH